MKITDVQTFLADYGRQNLVLVKITTDNGIVGWGEASVESNEKTVIAAVEILKDRYLLGADPTEIEMLWRLMYHEFWKGGYIKMSAISGIDQALWDILGKSLNVPVYKLLGGKVRNKVRTYSHINKADQLDWAAHLMDLGFGGVKISCEMSGPEQLDYTLKTVRGIIGPDRDLMVDGHGRTNAAQAKLRLQVAAKYDLFFYEEPVPPENPEEFKVVRSDCYAVPIAAGERTFSRFDARPLIENQLIDIYQPDVCHCGGITELRRLAAYAEVYHIRLAPHNPNGPIASAASLQVAAATQNVACIEFAINVLDHPTTYDYEFINKDGYLDIPERPGLGVNINEDALTEFPFRDIHYYPYHREDGSIIES